MKVYSKETYRLRELEKSMNIPIVSDFKSKACEDLSKEYPEYIEAYYKYKDINKEYKHTLNMIKKNYGTNSISNFKQGYFKTKKEKIEYKNYLNLLNKRREYNDAFKFIKPKVEELALSMYKNSIHINNSKDMREFLKLLKGLVIFTLNRFYKQPIEDVDFIEGIYQSCFLAYIQNFDRSFKKVDTFFVTHIINELSHNNTANSKEIPTDDFSKLDGEYDDSSIVVERKFNNELDRHLSWENMLNEL